MNKKFFAFLFSLPLICLIVWTLSLSIQQKNGQEVKVRIIGYDPTDILSGHYIAYQIDWKKTDCNQFKDRVCPTDNFCKRNKLSKIFSWSATPCRFYVPEKYAQQLDKAFRNINPFSLNSEKQDIFEVIYSYQEGKEPIAKQLLINGKDWRKFVK